MLWSLLLAPTHASLSSDLNREWRCFLTRCLRAETFSGHVSSVFPANATPPRRLSVKLGVALLWRWLLKCRTGELGQCRTAWTLACGWLFECGLASAAAVSASTHMHTTAEIPARLTIAHTSLRRPSCPERQAAVHGIRPVRSRSDFAPVHASVRPRSGRARTFSSLVAGI